LKSDSEQEGKKDRPRAVIVTGGKGYDGQAVDAIGDLLDMLHDEIPLARIAPLDVPVISETMVALERWVMQKRISGYRLPLLRLTGRYVDFLEKIGYIDADVVVIQMPVADGEKPARQLRGVRCIDVAVWAVERERGA